MIFVQMPLNYLFPKKPLMPHNGLAGSSPAYFSTFVDAPAAMNGDIRRHRHTEQSTQYKNLKKLTFYMHVFLTLRT